VEPLSEIDVLINEGSRQSTDIYEKEKLSLPRSRVRGKRKLFLFMVREVDEHHGAFGLGLGCSNAA